MSRELILAPAVAFTILFAVILLAALLFSRLSFRRKAAQSVDEKKAYSCGEEFTGHMAQPDYSQFFPFAFFFTILHVVALVIATVPIANARTFTIALLYIMGAITGLFVLLGKREE
jgi:NADH-quinone oxidoreductase subunit A